MKTILALLMFAFALASCSNKDSGNSTQETNKPITLDPVKPDDETSSPPAKSDAANSKAEILPTSPRGEDESPFDYCRRLKAISDPGAAGICSAACSSGDVPDSGKAELCSKTLNTPPSFYPNDCNSITNKVECKAKCCRNQQLFDGGGKACGDWVDKYGCPAI
jgi:hypothetical protein